MHAYAAAASKASSNASDDVTDRSVFNVGPVSGQSNLRRRSGVSGRAAPAGIPDADRHRARLALDVRERNHNGKRSWFACPQPRGRRQQLGVAAVPTSRPSRARRRPPLRPRRRRSATGRALARVVTAEEQSTSSVVSAARAGSRRRRTAMSRCSAGRLCLPRRCRCRPR
jgi:hypothetical protein